MERRGSRTKRERERASLSLRAREIKTKLWKKIGRRPKGPFTLSRIASRIIPDLNPGCSGERHHDFFSMPVWIRSELGVYTGKYGVSTDRQGSNADHAGNAYGANTDFQGRARRLLGTLTVLTRRCTLTIGMSPECWRVTWTCRRSFDIRNFKPGWNRC